MGSQAVLFKEGKMRAGENKILTQMWVHRVVVVVGFPVSLGRV
jgi:hypothetical protein